MSFAGLERYPLSGEELLVSLLILIGGAVAVTLVGTRGRTLILPLLVALIVRAGVALGQRITNILPQGQADAGRFERTAWLWSEHGCMDTSVLNMGGSYVHSWIMSQLYACSGIDRAPLVFQMTNVLLGLFTIMVSALIARRIWGQKVAVRAAWVMAFFPTLVLYSVVELREVWVTAFLMTGVYLVIRWMQDGGQHFFALGVAAIMGSAVFHGGTIFAIFGLGLAVLFVFSRQGLDLLATQRLNKRWGGAAIMVIAGSMVLMFGVEELRFSSIGDVTELGEQYEGLEDRQDRLVRGAAEYPSWLRLEGATDAQIVLLTPIRAAYLLFGPLPWDVRAPRHVIGLVDGLLYLAMVILLWQYRHVWWQKPELRLLLIMLAGLVLVYAWGTGNFGTGMRHRAKFVTILIVLAAGMLGKKRWRLQQFQMNGLLDRLPDRVKRRLIPRSRQAPAATFHGQRLHQR